MYIKNNISERMAALKLRHMHRHISAHTRTHTHKHTHRHLTLGSGVVLVMEMID